MGEHPPKKTLKEHAQTLGRRLKAVGAAGEYIGLNLKEGEVAEKGVQKGGMVPLYHSLGRGVMFLQAGWEDWRAKQLDAPRNASLIEKRRGALDARKTKIDADGEELERDAQAWHTATRAKVAEMNTMLAGIGNDRLVEKYRDTSDLLADIRSMRDYINELQRDQVSPEDMLVSDARIPAVLAGYRLQNEAAAALRIFENETASSWSSLVTRQDKLHKATNKWGRDEENAGTPEARIAKREALLDDRESLLASLHQAQLDRIHIRHRIAEKAHDIRELWAGRDPLFAREERQTTELRDLIVRLKDFRIRAIPFEDLNSIAINSEEILHPEHEEGRPNKTRRPIGLEIEKIVEGRAMPERVRRAIIRALPERYAPLYYSHILAIENIIEQAIADIGITKP